MSNVKSKRRLYIFDNLKFILMALVVVGHFADVGASDSPAYKSLFLFIYSFHMPLFLFISGVFHKNNKILQKIVTYVALGYLSKLVIYLTKLLVGWNAKFFFFTDAGLPWYMFVLAMFIGVSYLLRNADKKKVLAVSVALGLVVGYFGWIGDFLYLSRFFVFYPFFVLGQMTPKIVIINLNKMKTLKIISAVILTVWLVICFALLKDVYPLRYLFTGRNPFIKIEMFGAWGIFWRMLCYVITLIVSFCVICLVPRKNVKYISDFGKNTLQVYFWQTTFQLLIRQTGVHLWLFKSPVGLLVWLIIGALLSVLLSTKYFAFPTKQVCQLCSKIEK